MISRVAGGASLPKTSWILMVHPRAPLHRNWEPSMSPALEMMITVVTPVETSLWPKLARMVSTSWPELRARMFWMGQVWLQSFLEALAKTDIWRAIVNNL